MNLALAAADARDDARRIGARTETVGVAATRELPLLNPLPARFAGRRLEVRLGAAQVIALDAGKVVAEHTRSPHKGSEDLVLDHYLEVLRRKPGALAGSTALVAARAAGAFTAVHQRFWDAARKRHGDGPGTRALVGVLLLHRTLPASAVAAGMEGALVLGNFDVDLVAVQARSALLAGTVAAPPVPVPSTASQTATTPRPAPSLTEYDQLLQGAIA